MLGAGGPVAGALGATADEFENRPEQLKMAGAVAAAMESRRTLLVEAGTGVGKSFAYLVPAIVRCLLRNEKVVVATATISLQEQLIQKDIPLLGASLERWNLRREDGLPLPPLTPVLAKGRGNYLSVRRLQLASQRQTRLLDAEQRHSLHVIEEWAYTTKDGTLSTLPALDRPDVWEHARSDSDNCMGRKCPTYKQCFYQIARRELERANLIVCNHALFFSDLALRTRGVSGGSVLPAYDHVVLDEAHGLEDAACEHFGLSLTQARVSRLLRTLYQPRKGRGYLLEQSLKIADAEAVERAVRLCETAEEASRQFFDDLLTFAESRREASGRIRRPGVVDNTLAPAMRDMAMRLRSIRDAMDEGPDRFELSSYARRASEIADAADALVGQTLDGFVYWVDVEHQQRLSRLGPRVTLACAPVEVAPILRRALFAPPPPSPSSARDGDGPPPDAGDDFDAEIAAMGAAGGASAETDAPADAPNTGPRAPTATRPGIVLTSATLATRTARDGDHPERAEAAFSHIMTNLGIDDATTLQLGSPFDYARQARVVIDLSMPNPNAPGGGGRDGGRGGGPGPRDYNSALAARVDHHVRATRGGAFVLFTSFGTLYAVADRLREPLGDDGMPVLVQGRDGSRQHILKLFTQSENAVLFGAASFWQGVDVRGERLRNVIITRLPFEPPDRPLTQARLERIEGSGGNPFMHDSLPRAIIRFKQGFGRLIRSKTDKGRVVVLDPRIRTARYGKMFLDALPEGVVVEERRGESEFDL